MGSVPTAALPDSVPPDSVPSDSVPSDSVLVDGGVCRWVAEHRPRPDVAYRPGVDVRGRSVVPADLDDRPRLRVPDSFEVPVTVPLARLLGLDFDDRLPERIVGRRFDPPRTAPFDAEAVIGVVSVQQGRLAFNGQPLTDPAADAFAVFCAERPE